MGLILHTTQIFETKLAQTCCDMNSFCDGETCMMPAFKVKVLLSYEAPSLRVNNSVTVSKCLTFREVKQLEKQKFSNII